MFFIFTPCTLYKQRSRIVGIDIVHFWPSRFCPESIGRLATLSTQNIKQQTEVHSWFELKYRYREREKLT